MKKRKSLALLLTLVIVLGIVTVSVFADIKTDILPGDINGDGTVDTADAQILLDYLTDGRGSPDTSLLNVNGDEAIDNKDVAWLMNYIAKINDPDYDPNDPPVIYPAIYTLSFDANEGEVNLASKNIVAGFAVGELPTPTRTNYRFDGWFDAKSGGTELTAETVAEAKSLK